MAQELNCQGWQTRWAKYSNNQFQEGVSLTCADELSRWQKYGWGCSYVHFACETSEMETTSNSQRDHL